MAEDTGTPDGTKRTWSPARRAAAEAQRRKRAENRIEGVRSDTELVAEEVIGEAVDNIVTLAGYAMPIAPYTAVTIAGVPDPNVEGGWIVRSRAIMAGNVLLEHARRNPRILNAIARFNLMFRNVELLEVVGSVVAAGAVDAKLVPPDATVALPGGLEMPILAPAIGDTIAYIAAEQAAAAVNEGAVRVEKRADRGAAAAPSESAASGEPTPAQRAEAAATRARLEARAAALARGEPDPTTVRREGQTVVPGGVEDT